MSTCAGMIGLALEVLAMQAISDVEFDHSHLGRWKSWLRRRVRIPPSSTFLIGIFNEHNN